MRGHLSGFVLLILALFPLTFLVLLSVGQQWAFPAILLADWSLRPWVSAMGSGEELGAALGLSLGIALGVAAGGTLLGFATARRLAGLTSGRSWLRLAYLPYVFAPVLLAACLQFYFLRLGLNGTIGGVMLAQLFIVYPYAVILATGFWNERVRSMENLARTLGAGVFQRFYRVLLPVLRGPIAIVFFQSFLISWFEYGLTLLIGVGKVGTLPLLVFQFVNEANIFYAAMASVLLCLPPMLFLWLNKRLLFVHR